MKPENDEIHLAVFTSRSVSCQMPTQMRLSKKRVDIIRQFGATYHRLMPPLLFSYFLPFFCLNPYIFYTKSSLKNDEDIHPDHFQTTGRHFPLRFPDRKLSQIHTPRNERTAGMVTRQKTNKNT